MMTVWSLELVIKCRVELSGCGFCYSCR